MSVGRALSRGMSPSQPSFVLGTQTHPARAFNTTFQPSASRPTFVIYTVEISGVTTLLSGDDGTINLVADAGAPPTELQCSFRNRIVQTLGVTVGTRITIQGVLSYIVPAGHNVRLNTVVTLAAPVFTLVRVTEIPL